MNFLHIKSNLREYKNEMILKIPIALFHCDVNYVHSVHPMIEINDEDLIRLRDFLNSFFPKKE